MNIKEKTEKIRLIAADLDGTLLDDKKNISSHTADILNEAMKQGYYFTFCTGRQAAVMWKLTKYIIPNAPIICTNGGEVWDNGARKFCYRAFLENSSVISCVKFCRQHQIDFLCRTNETEYVNEGCCYLPKMRRRNEQAVSYGAKPQGIVILDGSDDERLSGLDFIKIVCYPDSDEKEEELTAFCAEDRNITVTRSSRHFDEIMPAGNDKGTGLEHVCESLGLTLENCCVFGDYDNDIPMFRKAGFRVAMGNANETIKGMSDYVTVSNNEDGVANAIKTLFLTNLH